MPKFSGFELCQSFRSLSYTSTIPILVITGETGAKFKDHCANLGAVAYFEKPDWWRRALGRFWSSITRCKLLELFCFGCSVHALLDSGTLLKPVRSCAPILAGLTCQSLLVGAGLLFLNTSPRGERQSRVIMSFSCL